MKTETPRQLAGKIATDAIENSATCQITSRVNFDVLVEAVTAALNAERERAFDQGYVCACANIMNLHGEEVIAREVLNANRPKDWGIIDPQDRKALQPVFDHEAATAAIRGRQ